MFHISKLVITYGLGRHSIDKILKEYYHISLSCLKQKEYQSLRAKIARKFLLIAALRMICGPHTLICCVYLIFNAIYVYIG